MPVMRIHAFDDQEHEGERAADLDIVFELCAETLDACRAAVLGGAHRIELCTALQVGGLTPSDALVEAAVNESALPVHVLLRPTAETFEYSPEMFRETIRSLRRARELGAAGFVVGTLRGGVVDCVQLRAFVDAAEGLPVTYHRAFDQLTDRRRGLEDVIVAGATRVLTSAGAPDVLSGAQELALLIAQAAGRVAVAAGGGLRLSNAAEVARTSGARHFHGSLRDPETEPGKSALNLEERIRSVISKLRRADTVEG